MDGGIKLCNFHMKTIEIKQLYFAEIGCKMGKQKE